MRIRFVLPLGLIAASLPALAQPPMDASRYDFALGSRMEKVAPLVLNAQLVPHWRDGPRERFTYRRESGEGQAEFIEVDAATGRKGPALDADIIARGLAAATGKPVEARRLPFMDYEEVGGGIRFDHDGQTWTCERKQPRCSGTPAPVLLPTEVPSPDGKWVAFTEGGNLWVRSADGGERFALTTDAEPRYTYAAESESIAAEALFGLFKTPPGEGTQRIGPPVSAPMLSVNWSPDSKMILTHRLDERRVRDISITQHVPTDGTLRPITWTWKSAQPDDAVIPMAEMWLFDVAARRGQKLPLAPFPVLYFTPATADEAWWSPDSSRAFLVTHSRYFKSVTLHVIDAKTSSVRAPISEAGPTFVSLSAIGEQPMVYPLGNGDVLWYSQRTGYGHLYLYDGNTGALKRQLTKGNHAVRNVLHIDEAKGLVYVAMTTDEPGSDPYLRAIYSVRLRDGATKRLGPEVADHYVAAWQETIRFAKPRIPEAVAMRKLGFAPSGRYFVEGYSLTDQPNRFVLRQTDGRPVAELEATDVSPLQARGWVPPQRFSALAADGKSLVYGTIWKPHDFDPTKRYAVLDSNYPGPQMQRVRPGFNSNVLDWFDPQPLADLGMIVVALDGAGTPGRSKRYQDLSYARLADAGGLEDHVAALRDLAGRHSWMDLDRVGIIGSSGGGFAAARALLMFPDFFKVGVSDAGSHDVRNYIIAWGENYIGPDNAAAYAAAATKNLAPRLKGKLLILHGDMDANVPPSQSLQLADALLEANRDFDLVVVPNMGHTTLYVLGTPLRIAYDYLVRNLMGEVPPIGYEIKPAGGQGH